MRLSCCYKTVFSKYGTFIAFLSVLIWIYLQDSIIIS